MTDTLSGKVALVTGASGGLGAAIAIGLAAEGATVVAVARRADRLADTCASHPRLMHAEPADLSAPSQVEALAERVIATHGRIDVLVNNAAAAPAGDFLDQDPREWRHVFEVNVLAPMALAQAAGRSMVVQGGGRIINIASIAGLRGKPKRAAYSASKGALILLTRSLAAELAQHDIQVTAIAPGAFRTEAQEHIAESPELLAQRVASIPARRMAEPEEIVPLVVLLASPGSAFITGEVFVIDGGETAKF